MALNTEYVWIGHGNTVDLLLLKDGVALTTTEMDDITKITITVGSVTVESTDKATGPIKWRQTGYQDNEIRIDIGGQAISAGEYKAPLVVYDSANVDGIVWGYVPLFIEDEVEDALAAESGIITFSGTDLDTYDYTGANILAGSHMSVGSSVRYNTRDSTKVLEFVPASDGHNVSMWAVGLGSEDPQGSRLGTFDVTALAYLDQCKVTGAAIGAPGGLTFTQADIQQDGNPWTLYAFLHVPVFQQLNPTSSKTLTADWYRMRLRIEPSTPALRFRVWDAGSSEPSSWDIEQTTEITSELFGPFTPGFYMGRLYAASGACELAELAWQQVSL